MHFLKSLSKISFDLVYFQKCLWFLLSGPMVDRREKSSRRKGSDHRAHRRRRRRPSPTPSDCRDETVDLWLWSVETVDTHAPTTNFMQLLNSTRSLTLWTELLSRRLHHGILLLLWVFRKEDNNKKVKCTLLLDDFYLNK